MSSWTPQPKISPKEMVGRRAFTTKLRQPNGHYKADVFLDDRIGTGLSMDRLGIRPADAEKVTKELMPLCEAMATKRERPFTGWAQLRVSDVPKLVVEATEADGEVNPYHAEVNRDNCTDQNHLYMVAFMLATMASMHEFVEPPG